VGAVVRVALAVLLLLLPACTLEAPDRSTPAEPRLVAAEPGRVAAFLAALSRGDEEAAEKVTSPLYRAEWERRGLSRAERRSLHADMPSRAAFAFAGGARDAAGFGHHLYLAQPPPRWHLQPTSPSVWRVDTDPDGWVIWAELVYLFGSGGSITATEAGASGPDAPMPAALASRHPRPLVRLQADATPESYNLIRVDRSATSRRASPGGAALVFYGADEEGGLRPGAWSYGEPVGTNRAYGQPRPPALRLDAGIDGLQAAYVASLSGGP
jgi:hypothetical protein